jgi:hypothetical protein
LEPWLRRYSRKTIKNVFSIQKSVEKCGNPENARQEPSSGELDGGAATGEESEGED